MRGPAIKALARYNYRLFLAGQLTSQTGGWMQRVAQAWLVLDLTESPAALGTVTTLQFLPILLFSLFAGTLADRFPKRRVLAIVQVVGAVQALTLAGLVATGRIELWHVYVLAFIHGTATATEQPLRQAFPVELVGRDLLATAVALNSATFNTARILGPALGGVVVVVIDLEGAFAMNALSYLVVLLALALMRPAEIRSPNPVLAGNVLSQIGEALVYAVRSPVILFTLGILMCLGIFGFNYLTFIPLLARYVLDLGPSGYGALSAALGSGALVGALVMARLGKGSTAVLVAGAVAFSVLLGSVGLSAWFPLTMALMFMMGSASVAFSTTANTTVQLAVPDAMRGRIMGLYTLLLAGMTPPGAIITGVMADAWGIQAALGIEALVCLAGVGGGLLYLGWARRHRHQPAATWAGPS